MVLTFENNDAARSLDKQQMLDWHRGWQVIDPAGGSNLVTVGTGNFEYDAAAGDINAGGTTVTCSLETVDFANDIDADNDQLAVIYRDSSGNLQKTVGSTGTRDPAGQTVRQTHTPAAPSMHATDGVVLAEVLLPAGASSIGSDELRDRRLTGELILDSLDGDFVSSAITTLDGDGLKVDTGALQVEPADFAGNALEDDGNDNLAVSASGIQTAELDLTISPTWTGTHTFSSGVTLGANATPDSAGSHNIGTATTYFNEMHATAFTTHSPLPRNLHDALDSIKGYTETYGSMQMGEMIADLVTVVTEQQVMIEELRREVDADGR